jgi:hypothetical protein
MSGKIEKFEGSRNYSGQSLQSLGVTGKEMECERLLYSSEATLRLLEAGCPLAGANQLADENHL